MKKLIILTILTLVTSTAYASGISCDTYFGKNYSNKCNPDTNTHTKRNHPLGFGTDIPLYINNTLTVDLETRLDTQNKTDSDDFEVSTMVVAKPYMQKGVLQHIVSFLKGIFTRDS